MKIEMKKNISDSLNNFKSHRAALNNIFISYYLIQTEKTEKKSKVFAIFIIK